MVALTMQELGGGGEKEEEKGCLKQRVKPESPVSRWYKGPLCLYTIFQGLGLKDFTILRSGKQMSGLKKTKTETS